MTRGGAVLLACLLVIATAAATVHASDRYDPRFRFRTLRTPNFDIHFHQGTDAEARRLALLAEQVRRELQPRLGVPAGRVHVILVDQNDASNGWATPFPYNVIELTAAAPRGGSLIGNTSDWLRLVFVHEYTHILHLDRSRGLFAAGRRVFGRHPIAMPNIFTPPWQIEGIATHYESAITGEGRVPAGDFRLLLDRAARRGAFASLDRASSDRVEWPSGNTPYLYGGYFHAYLAETYGDAALGRLADATAKRLPYLGSRAYEDVFGKSLGSLWSDFEAASQSAATTHRDEATRLTSHGFIVASPAYAADGRLFYSTSNPHGFPALRELEAGGRSREVTTKVGSGRVGAAGSTVVFDQLEYVRSVGLQSDLYEVDTASGVVRRLTHERRAADPDITADGERLVFVIQAADRRILATMPRDGAMPRHLISAPDTHFASPRWSPDGRSIVAERRVRGGPSQIVLVDAATADLRVISGRGRSTEPSWTPDGRAVLYASATADGFEVQYVDITTVARRRLLNAGASARWPVLSPDGATLVFVGYSVDGHDLFSLPWSAADWAPVADDRVARPAAPLTAELGGFVSSEGAYRPWRMLLPHFWTPILATDSDEWTVGAATAGADALGRHAYAAGAAWTTRARPDWYAGYIYDRWRSTVFLSASDDTDPWRQGSVRTREIDGGISIPFRTVRRTQALSASLHLSNDRVRCDGCERPVDTTIRRHALRGGWTFTSARTYGYSISREAGFTLSAGGEWVPGALGSTGTASAIVADARAFLPAAPRHGVLAARVAGVTAWGDDTAVRVFGAGGAGRETLGVSFDRDAVGVIRGFDVDAVSGRRALVANADYRLPLAWVERGVGTWPAFVRSLHGALFIDAGAAWNRRLSRDQLRVSTGVELAADLVLGYVAPVTVAGGVTWRHDPSGASRGAAVFARLGRAF